MPLPHVTVPDLVPLELFAVGGTPSTGPFNIQMSFFDNADIKVALLSDELTMTETTDYTLVGTVGTDGGYEGGALTLVSAVSNDTVVVWRDVAIERTSDQSTSGNFDIAALNLFLDKMVAGMQQVEETADRGLHVNRFDADGKDMELPALVDRRCLVWDAGTGAFIMSTYDPDTTTADTAASAAAAAASEIAAAASETAAAASEAAAATSETNAGNSETAAQAAQAAAEAAAAGIYWKVPVLNATTANITLSGEQTIDGVLTSTSRILVKDQTAPEENGIYVTAAGAWARATPMDTWGEHVGAAVIVSQGTAHGDTSWICTVDAGGTLETTSITWAEFGGGDMKGANNLSDVASAATAFANIKQSATDTATGAVELATDAEVATGTDTARAVTPAGAASHYSPRTRTVNAQTGTTYTLVLGDAGDIVTMNNASANTLTVPTNASVAFPVGTQIDIVQIGTGATTTVAFSGGVTVNGVGGGSATLTAQYSAVTAIKIATNEWLLVGDHGGVA